MSKLQSPDPGAGQAATMQGFPRRPRGGALTWAGSHAGREAGPVSLEVPVLQVAVLKGEAFLLPLAPLLVVKVDVGALAGGEGGQ